MQVNSDSPDSRAPDVLRGGDNALTIKRLWAAGSLLAAGTAVTVVGAGLVPVWGDFVLLAGFVLCLVGGVRLLKGGGLVMQYGCGPGLGVALFLATFFLTESPDAAARRSAHNGPAILYDGAWSRAR